MSEKTLKAALGTLLGLVIVYAVVTLASGRGGSGSSDAEGTLVGAFDGLSEDAVSSVLIASPTDTVELARGDAGWTANGNETDSAAVARFWDAVEDAEVGDLVARNAANHRRLGVAADSTWTVAFHRSGGGETRILLGKTGPSFSSAFARLPEEDAVFLLDGGLRGAATRRLDDWRDRVIVKLDTAQVTRVEVEREGDRRVLVRVDSTWSLESGPADSAGVVNLLRELASLQATGFAPDTASLDDGVRTVRALSSGGDTLAVLRIGETDGTPRAQLQGNSTIFTLSSWRADRVAPALEDLEGEEEEPSAEEPDTTPHLEEAVPAPDTTPPLEDTTSAQDTTSSEGNGR